MTSRLRTLTRRSGTGLFGTVFSAAVLATTLGSACGGESDPYKPHVPPEGVTANLPTVPTVPADPVKVDESYTVWGASYHMRSRVHHEEVSGRSISITGYVTRTNLDEAPKCAIHPTGKEDPKGCEAPIPTFWLGDTADADPKNTIKVLGWASNFAQIYDAVKTYRKRRRSRRKKEWEPLSDNFWGVALPSPLPGAGAKVTVTGNYSTAFTRATSGTESDPIMGVMTYNEMTYEEEPGELATLPGLRP